MNKDSLGDRMKQYENIPKNQLMRRQPVIIRIDGKAFHTFTKGFKKPFDDILMRAMEETAAVLCRDIEGVKVAYTQSDEISLLITNNDTWETQPWFGNNLQKMASVAASIATLAFNRAFWHEVNMLNNDYLNTKDTEYLNVYCHACEKGATFDARVFVLPADEVCNYFWWRQADAQRNSIQACGQSYFSHKELQHKSSKDIQEKLLLEKNFDWNALPNNKKYGVCIVKKPQTVKAEVNFNTSEIIKISKNKWVVDENIPLFFENRDYINQHLKITL